MLKKEKEKEVVVLGQSAIWWLRWQILQPTCTWIPRCGGLEITLSTCVCVAKS